MYTMMNGDAGKQKQLCLCNTDWSMDMICECYKNSKDNCSQSVWSVVSSVTLYNLIINDDSSCSQS